MKRKSFPFYYEKYIAGTYYLTRREKGAYVDLLCFQADKGSMTIENIKEVLNGDFDCWEKIKSKFIEQGGIYVNKKLQAINNGTDKPVINIDEIETELKKRKEKFYNDLIPYISKYPKEMLRCFYNYWTERNKSGVKMRFELERVFEISKRLSTWARRDKDFQKTETPRTYAEMLKLMETDPDAFKKYKAVKLEGERQATFYPINQNI